MDERLMDAVETQKLAGLPGKDVLIAKFLGSLMSPLSGLARFFDGAKQELEKTGGKTVADLIKETEAPEKEAAPAKEEPKTEKEEVAEAPKKEAVPEATKEKAETPAKEAPAAEEEKPAE